LSGGQIAFVGPNSFGQEFRSRGRKSGHHDLQRISRVMLYAWVVMADYWIWSNDFDPTVPVDQISPEGSADRLNAFSLLSC